jgi:hypothetical protein
VRVVPATVLIIVVLLASSCGGGGNSNSPSASVYKGQLKTIAGESDAAQHAVEKGFQSTSVPQLVKVLGTFAATEKRIGDQVAKLDPPKDAVAANAELAGGQRDTASEVHAVLPKIEKMTSTKAAIAYLSKAPTTKGGREVDEALAKLKHLGYIKSVS